MAWQKSSAELTARFQRALPHHPDLVPKQMFGYPACFVKGHFFAGLHEETVVIKLPPSIHAGFPELASAPRFNPMGRGAGMKDWYVLPASVADSAERLEVFLRATFAEVVQLPAKEGKSARRSGAPNPRRGGPSKARNRKSP